MFTSVKSDEMERQAYHRDPLLLAEPRISPGHATRGPSLLTTLDCHHDYTGLLRKEPCLLFSLRSDLDTMIPKTLKSLLSALTCEWHRLL